MEMSTFNQLNNELNKKIEFNIDHDNINNQTMTGKNLIELNNGIKKKFDFNSSVISKHTSNMNNNERQEFITKKIKNGNICLDKKFKGYFTAKDSQYRANHLVHDIKRPTEVAVAYNTGFSEQSMGFKLIGYKTMDKIFKEKEDFGYYENLGISCTRKLYFDIDFYEKTIEDYEKVKEHLFEIFKGEGVMMSNENIRETGYVGTKKDMNYISYHIVVNNGMVFENQEHTKNFMDYMILKYPILQEYIDCVVYDKYRNFRMPNQSKNGKITSIQKDTKSVGTVQDYLITYSNETYEFYHTLDVNELDIQIIGKKTKKLTNKVKNNTLNHTSYYTAFPDGFSVSIGENDDSLEYLMKSIPNNEKVGYDVFLKIGMSLKRTVKDMKKDSKKGLELWYAWTKQYDDCDYNKLRSLYNGFSTNGAGKRTLIHLAKIFNPRFDMISKDSKVCKFFDVDRNFMDMDCYDIEERFINNGIDLCEKIMENKNTIVKSPMGTGKSYGIRKILNNPHVSICYLSCKKAFCNAMFNTLEKFGFVNYLNEEKKSITDFNKIIISIESLKYARDTYDYVFLDECETLFTNLTGEMNIKSNPVVNNLKLSNLLTNSNHLVYMDAYVSMRTIEFVKEQKKDTEIPVYIENHFKYDKRTYKECMDIHMGKKSIKKKDVFVYDIMRSIRKGDKIGICSGSKRLLERVEQCIIEEFPNLKYKFYKSGQGLKECNVNKEWNDIKVLMYSPTITAGISYDDIPENIPFDKLFLYIGFSKNPLSRDIIQAHKRVRKYTNTEMTVCIMNIPNLIQYDALPTSRKIIEEYETEFKKDMYKNDAVLSMTEVEDLKIFQSIYINNIMERNINDTSLEETMKYFMTYENIIRTGGVNIEGFEICGEEIMGNTYNSIEDMSLMEYEDLKERLENEDYDSITDSDMERKQKYTYDNILTIKDLDTEIKQKYYDENYLEGEHNFGSKQKAWNTSNFIQRVKEGCIEDWQKDINETVEEINSLNDMDEGEVDSIIELKIHKYKKMEVIRDMMNRLGLYNKETEDLDINKEFNTIDIEKMMEVYKPIKVSSINKILTTETHRNSNKEKEEFSIMNMKSLINVVMNDHMNLVVSKPLTTKKVSIGGGKRKNVKTFRLVKYDVNGQEDINGFQIFRTTDFGRDKNRTTSDMDFLPDEEDYEHVPLKPLTKEEREIANKKRKDFQEFVPKDDKISEIEYKIKKKLIVQDYYKKMKMNSVVCSPDRIREANRLLTMEMNTKISKECGFRMVKPKEEKFIPMSCLETNLPIV